MVYETFDLGYNLEYAVSRTTLSKQNEGIGRSKKGANSFM